MEIAFLLSEIKMMSCFLSTDDKQKFLVKLEDRAVFEKGLDTFNSSFLSAWLRIQIWIIKRLRSFNMYEDIVVMWNPYLYYLIFPLFMVITYIIINKTLANINLSWPCILLSIIPIVVLVVLKKIRHKMDIQKSEFIECVMNKSQKYETTIRH